MLYFKDLAPQIAWKTVFIVEYAGPLFITLALALCRKTIYSTDQPMTFNQSVGAGLGVFHFMKRELETLFVHRFATDTMPGTIYLRIAQCTMSFMGSSACTSFFNLPIPHQPGRLRR